MNAFENSIYIFIMFKLSLPSLPHKGDSGYPGDEGNPGIPGPRGPKGQPVRLDCVHASLWSHCYDSYSIASMDKV